MDYNGHEGHPRAHLNSTLSNATAAATKAMIPQQHCNYRCCRYSHCKYNAKIVRQHPFVWDRKKVKGETCGEFMEELGQQTKHHGTKDPRYDVSL